MDTDRLETARLRDALHQVHSIEINMQVLTAALKQRGFIDARIALAETQRLVSLLVLLLDELDPPRAPLHF